MVDRRLHPALAKVLESQGWTGLTPAQEAAWEPLHGRRHTLLMAPTGYGKTEAAMLPLFDRLLRERDALQAARRPWPPGFKALYVTPLRALNRDLLARLEDWGKQLDLPIGVRHGDTSQAERARQSRSPPDILITTPETVQLLLYGDTLRRHLATVRFVIIDEVHDLAASERGSQLAVALERIEEVIAQPAALRHKKANERPCPAIADGQSGFQRIGLSATVADPQEVAAFLGGAQRDVELAKVTADRDRRLNVVSPDVTEDDRFLAAELALPPTAVAQLRTVRKIVDEHERVLVFHNTRDGAELLANRAAMLDERDGREPVLGLHHGSLSAEHRVQVESDFKEGRIRALVATSSLELGIDIGAIDHVVQVGSPRSVARLIQRLGRAGHRVGAVSEGTLIASGPEEHLECLAIARKAEAGELEPIEVRESPLVVLANQLIALTNEYAGLDKQWAWQVITRAAPFASLDEGLYEQVWETLLDVQTLFEQSPGHIARGGRARRHFLEHISLIPDEKTYRVIDESTKRSIGTVDDAFIAAGLHPGAGFVMAGRSWRVLEIQTEHQKVRVAPAKELHGTPQWAGSQLPVSLVVAQEVARLRGEIDRRTLSVPQAEEPIRAHRTEGLDVPTDLVVTLEHGRSTVVCNIALGTRGNEALGRITAALLQQRLGGAVQQDTDAYRVHLRSTASPREVMDVWQSLDPDTLDLLLGLVLRDQPVVRHHLVHVAKHFGALPKQLDPTRTTRKKLDELWDRLALQEEALSRLIHDRFDLGAVAAFLHDLQSGKVRLVAQALGPISRLGQDEARKMVAPPRSDEKLLAEVRRRIEDSEVLLVCTNCGHRMDTTAGEVPRKVRCRRCGSGQMGCFRPWDEERLRLLTAAPGSLTRDEQVEKRRLLRNGSLMGAYGQIAALALCARGVGPDTAGRILQKVQDPEAPAFWRELLTAELDYARTNAFWKR